MTSEPGRSMAFMSGGGDAGALMRAHDWASTPLGPVDEWSTSLCALIGVLLHSRQPMFLWWGPELVQFYNDAYTPSFGVGKHPAAMGQRGADCWQEIWPIIWPQIDDAMARGIASWNVDHHVPINRNGRLEEVYWTYGYSPVYDDDGQIGGCLVVCTETTERVVSERRLSLLQRLTHATGHLTDSAAVKRAAFEVLSEGWAGDEAFALMFTDEAVAQRVVSCGLTGEDEARLTEHLQSRVVELSEAKQVHSLPEELSVVGRPWPEPVRGVYVTPIKRGATVEAHLVVGVSPRLPFEASYARYLDQMAELLGMTLSRVEAFRVRTAVEGERDELLRQAPVATAIMVGPEHTFYLANDRYLELVGGRDILGKSYLEAFPEVVGQPIVDTLAEVYRSGVAYSDDELRLSVRGPDGELVDRYFTYAMQPVRRAGEVYGLMVVAMDITAQVRARIDLEQGGRDRERLLRELKTANRAKDEFLAMLGHELRNPLSPIMTALEIMQMRGVGEAEPEREIIERQLRHVVTLVDDLLDVSRITRGVLELRRAPVALADAVRRAIEQASPLIDSRGHSLEVDVDPELVAHGDDNRLAQIIANLLTNAAKYTPRGGAIVLSARRSEGRARVSILDNGQGIEPTEAARLFQIFERGSERREGGLGLGLTIVKSLVDAHGGTVELKSEGEGRGTEAVVTLPLADSSSLAPRARATADAEETEETEGRDVLVVDDNIDAAEMLATALRRRGHRVRVAFEPVAALRLATEYRPDVAVLDLGLPVLDGCALKAELTAIPGWDGVRFFALTGYGQSSDRDRTKAAGFEVHLVKPVELAALDAQIRGDD